MFVQIIRGTVLDREAYDDQMEEWQSELKPGATGYLGMTGGITAAGDFVSIVRFESSEAARANSDRPEQGEWWERTSKLLENVTFADTSDITVQRGGGSDEAGFVQIIDATVSDRARVEALLREFEANTERPDVIGGLVAWQGDSRMTMVMYFTSEAGAREGEAREPSPEAKALDEEWQSLITDLRFTDLTEPVFDSAA